ncbi:diguanylate cyclase [Marinomonas sp. C2222]|uniref:diguanylate cyclase n=1 Tax=Marinomonas sargassi TaxID=2984494 RepID=A0ABT2YP60_9GAMM|nr:diguanylate cyclase [Marinomonas sargassi]MCV2401680.1 diguanylate cyclase [Marinomonas sargassi]
MAESSSVKLIEILRKIISRTSIIAEGSDPKLDSALREIRQATTKGENAEEILKVFNKAEPLFLNSEEVQLKRAKAVRKVFHELVSLLEQNDSASIPKQEKRQFESSLRKHWQTPAQWPTLLIAFLSLTKNSLTATEAAQDTNKDSVIKRIFNRREEDRNAQNNQQILAEISNKLSGLMSNLQLPSHHDDGLAKLKAALRNNDNLEQLPDLLDDVIHYIMIIIGKTEENLTNYLNQLNKQLSSINSSITDSYQSQKTLSQSREGFNTTLQEQVSDTNNAVQGANNLDSLKTLIGERLTTISQTMEEHKTQMEEQEKQANSSIASLKNKVTRMEKDTTSLRSMLQEKLAQAITDSLTELPNRMAYQDAVSTLCKKSHQSKQPLCLAVCDIDHFKRVNDTWGHLAGDKVLRLVPKQIQSTLAKEDSIFRYGGEEFVIIFPNTNAAQAAQRAEDIRRAVEKTPFNMQGKPVSISISIGVAELSPAEDPESLFFRADKLLYSAKESGRNRVMLDK